MTSLRLWPQSAPGTRTDEDWRENAACLQADPELFFPIGHSGRVSTPADSRPAVAVCERCPVRVECLTFALAIETENRHGVWGGALPEQRAKLHRLRITGPDAVALLDMQRRATS